MSLSIGIIGLPNVGKSTVFNALTQAQNAEVANYPFCTIQPNRAVVPVPDPRLEHLAELVKAPKIIHATIEFVDIAGLVKDAHRGEGLGNQFLGQIRNTDAILHIVRCFEDPNVVHVSSVLDPVADIEVINLELVMADLEQLEKRIEKLSSQVKGDRSVLPELDLCFALTEHLKAGKPVSSFPDQATEDFPSLVRELRFLTAKPVIYIANTDECGIVDQNPSVSKVKRFTEADGTITLPVCAKLETEIVGFDPAEKSEMMEIAGIEETGLDLVVRSCFELLGLICFFTKNENEVRAWEVPAGTKAARAAGEIHSDIERGFIRAEVVPIDVFLGLGSDAQVRAAGKLRLEGRDYEVQDGDVIYFRFSV